MLTSPTLIYDSHICRLWMVNVLVFQRQCKPLVVLEKKIIFEIFKWYNILLYYILYEISFFYKFSYGNLKIKYSSDL